MTGKKRGRPPLPKTSVAKIVWAYARGRLTIKGVGVALGLSAEDARSLLDAYGIDHRPTGRRVRNADDEDEF